MTEPKPPPPEAPTPDTAEARSPMSAFYQRHDPAVLERLRREWEAARQGLRKYF